MARPVDRDVSIVRRQEVRRIGRVLMYAGLVVAGIFNLLFPSTLVDGQVPPSTAVAWALGMTVTAFICFLGSITDRWLGEYSGLPLLIAILVLYSGSAWASVTFETMPLLAYGMFIFSFACGLFARWRDVQATKVEASLQGSQSKGA